MIDSSSWPVVRWTMPARIPDEDAERVLAEFDALLRRGERFVVIQAGELSIYFHRSLVAAREAPAMDRKNDRKRPLSFLGQINIHFL